MVPLLTIFINTKFISITFMTKDNSLLSADFDFASFTKNILVLEADIPNSDLLSVLRGSLDLDKYRRTLDVELKEMEKRLLSVIVSDADSLVSLYKDANDCETILDDMDKALSGFADSLGGVSDEIRQLQDKSEELSNQLKTRSEVQEKLISFVDGAVVPPDLVHVICEEEDCSSDRFLTAVQQLARKLRTHVAMDPTLPSVAESSPEFQKIKLKAVGRIREFVTSKLSVLKQPKSNLREVQSAFLLKIVDLIKFLRELDSGVFYLEIANFYFAYASKFYQNFFKTYTQTLSRVPVEPTATKSDLVGYTEGGQSEISGLMKLGGSSSSQLKTNALTLPDIRERVMKEDIDSEPLTALTEITNRIYPEALLRSHQKLFMEAAACEYMFLRQFFDLEDSNTDLQRFFDSVFDKSLSYMLEYVGSSLVRDCHDSVGLILCVRIVEHFQDQMANKRKIPCLDSYFENLLSLIRLRLKYTIEQHVDSLKRIDVKKVPLNASGPLPVTRKFSELASSLLYVRGQLNSEDPQLSNQIETLVSVYDALMASIGKRLTSQTDQQVWHLNNLDVILSLFRERQLNAETVPAFKKFQEKLNMYMSVFVEHKLGEHFGVLIKMTTDLEKTSGPNVSVSEMERQIVWFQQNWKSEVQKIHKEIVSDNLFSSFAIGIEIAKSAMTQLLLYYTRFQKGVNGKLPSGGAWSRQIVPSAVIMAEIKQIQ